MKIVNRGLSVLLVAVFVILCGSSFGHAAQEVKKEVWKVAAMSSEELPLVRALKRFETELEARVPSIDVQVFPNGQLGTSTDQTLGAVQNGIIEMTEQAGGNSTEYTKAFVPLDVPFLFLSREQAIRFMQNQEAFEIIRDRVRKESGLEVICFLDLGFRNMTNSKHPIASADDFKGLKIRTMSNNIHMKAFELLGGQPTAMAFSEVFTALQQGTIDAQENPVDTIYLQKFYEPNKYISMTDHVYSIQGLFMNATKYSKLSDDVKKAIAECVPIIQEQQFAESKAFFDKSVQLLKDAGAEVNFVDFSAKKGMQELVKPAWDLAASISGKEYFDKLVAIVKELE